MAGLDSIGVRVEGLAAEAGSAHNALPVLHEIKHALEKLANTGEPTTIDLSAIPFGPSDKNQLFDQLGLGEVEAQISALGDSKIRETEFPGVWLVQHFSPQGNELTTHIEITRMPSILITPEEDIKDSAAALAARIKEAP